MYCLRLLVVVYKFVILMLLMDFMCIPTFIVVTALVVKLHRQIGLYYNVWPKAIFHAETGSKMLRNFLI